MYNTIIIGAGVAGLIAAGQIAQNGKSVIVLEKMERTARKLRITGKGRCNITNSSPVENHIEKLRSENPEFILNALQNCDSDKTIELFNQMGIQTIMERGTRIYPKSQSAVDVAQRLTGWAEKQGAKILCNTQVEGIIKTENTFTVTTNDGQFEAENVIIATGGVSYPKTGSTGDGYKFAHKLGHDIISIRPALVALKIPDIIPPIELKNTGIALYINGVEKESRFGDVDFTDRGLAGATTLQLSRIAVDAICNNEKVTAVIDLKPALSQIKLSNRIKRELENLQNATFKVLLQKLTPSALHNKIATTVDIPLNTQLKWLQTPDVEYIAKTLKALKFIITDYGSFNEAIITAGGINTSEIDSLTMESKLISGLYFCGEVMDIDSDTGGYNIQLAVATASLAAKNIVK